MQQSLIVLVRQDKNVYASCLTTNVEKVIAVSYTHLDVYKRQVLTDRVDLVVLVTKL